MPRGAKPGERRGGRAAGKPNKATAITRELLMNWAGKAIDFHVAVLDNDLQCGVCRGTGKTKFQSGKGEGERKCQSCWGSGKERIDPRTRQTSADSILDRAVPKLKAIEHSDPGGKPIGSTLVELLLRRRTRLSTDATDPS